jgi:predicted hotdog family 3-hydroxylacyl-ACP dehydratase
MRVSRPLIERLLPQRGAMCLIDTVLDWDAGTIRCTSSTHRNPDHPLRGPLGLASANAIEYGAQAMALHAALAAGAADAAADDPAQVHDPADACDRSAVPDEPGAAPAAGPAPHGVVASVRSLVLHVPYLDWYREDLRITAELEAGDRAGALYRFQVEAGLRPLATGRVAVMFTVGVPA